MKQKKHPFEALREEDARMGYLPVGPNTKNLISEAAKAAGISEAGVVKFAILDYLKKIMPPAEQERPAKYMVFTEDSPGCWSNQSMPEDVHEDDGDTMTRTAQECGFESYEDAWDDVRQVLRVVYREHVTHLRPGEKRPRPENFKMGFAIARVEFSGELSAADVVKSAPPRLVPIDA